MSVNNLIPHVGNALSNDYLRRVILTEEANIRLCGAMLGGCYIMGELTATLMNNAMSHFRHRKWFRQDIKQTFNKSKKALDDFIILHKDTSPSGGMYIQTIADWFDEELQHDFIVLKASIYNEIGRHTKNDVNDIAEMSIVSIMFACIECLYDSRIEYMKHRFDTDYDRFYSQCRCDLSHRLWDEAMDTFLTRHYKGTFINLTDSKQVGDALYIIQKKLDDSRLIQRASESAKEYKSDTHDAMIESIAQLVIGA